MDVCHDEKADDKSSDAGNLYLVIRVDAASHVVGDLAVEDDDGAASGCDK